MSYLKTKQILFLGLAVFTLMITACGDEGCDRVLILPDPSNSERFNNELVVIDSYIEDLSIDDSATVGSTDSGLHFIINEPGSASKPTICDEVNVTYVGYFLNGEQFDANTFTFGLTNVIRGWTEGIPLFGEEGSGTIIIPSYLGYAGNPPPGIPANSILVFDVTLNFF